LECELVLLRYPRADAQKAHREENQMKKGLLMVLTGDAEDKTVSAFGQVFRALGQGVRVCVIDF